MMRTFLLWISLCAICAQVANAETRLATTDKALELYGGLTGITILRPSRLPALAHPIVIQSTNGPDDRQRAAELIQAGITDSGFSIKPQGDKFAVVLPKGMPNPVGAPPIVHAPPETTGTSKLSRGTVRFQGADLDQVLEIYSAFRGRTILQPAGLPAGTIQLRTESELTKEEVIYAFNAVLALNGLATVDDGERFVQIAPLSMASNVKAEAPARNPDDDLIATKEIPEFRESQPPRAPSVEAAQTLILAMARAGAIEDGTASELSTAELILGYYASLLQVKLQPSKEFSNVTVVFRAQTPLTKPELLYALKTVLGLNGLAIQTNPNDSIRLQRN